jgi:hypothetical protein
MDQPLQPNFSIPVNMVHINSSTLITNFSQDFIVGCDNFVKIAGINAPFVLSGITEGTESKIITVYNSTSQNMTIINNCSDCPPSQRILTLAGNNITYSGIGSVTFQYDAKSHIWILVAAKY